MATNEGDNPFGFLLDIPASTTKPNPVTPNNPFGFLLDPVADPLPREATAGARFARGIAAGATRPVRAFTRYDPETEGIAGAAGEILGFGVAFVPFFKGAGAVMRVAGFGSRAAGLAATGARTAPSLGFEVARGGLAFGGFEAFAGEDPAEAPERFAKGVAIGALGDLAILGGIRAYRGLRGKKWKPTEVPLPTPRQAPNVAIHPLSMKLELAMRPSFADSPELAARKLSAIGDPEKQLYESFTEIVRDFMPGGQGILPSLTSQELGQLYKVTQEGASNIRLAPFRRIAGEDAFDVLVADLDRSIWAAEHIPEKMTMNELLDAVQKRFPGLGVEFKDVLKRGVLGRYLPIDPVTGNPIIQVATGTREYQAGLGVSTLLHEVTHHASMIQAGTRLKQSFEELGTRYLGLDEIFDLAKVDRASLEKQLQEVTHAVLEIKRRQLGSDASRSAIEEFILSKPKYFKRAEEQVSRMSELMFLDPIRAKVIAPDGYKLVGELIEKTFPQVRQLLSRESQVMLDAWMDRWVKLEKLGTTTVFRRGTPQLSSAALTEYERYGWTAGLRALTSDGKSVLFLERMAGGKAKVKNLSTGVEYVTEMAQLRRPLIQNLVEQREEVLRAVDGLLDKRPAMLPVTLTDDAVNGIVRRGLINTSDFTVVNTSIREWIRTLPEPVQENVIQRVGQLVPAELSEIPAGMADEVLDEILTTMNSKGILRFDNGRIELYVKDDAARILSDVTESVQFGAPVAGKVQDRILRIDSPRSWLEYVLREQGVAEVDMSHFSNLAMERYGQRIRQTLVSPEVRALDDAVQHDLLGYGDDDIVRLSARANMEVEHLPSGEVMLRDRASQSILGQFPDEDYASVFLREMAGDEGPPILDFPGALGNGGGSLPGKGNTVAPIPSGRFLGVETFLGPHLTAFVNWAKRLEHQGIGPAFSSIYNPVKNAAIASMQEVSDVPRALLGGKSFGDAIVALKNAAVKIPKKRYPYISGYVEALTKEEIARSGGLMQRAMTPAELRVSKMAQDFGLQHDFPRLLTTSSLLDHAVASKAKLQRTIDRMRQIELSPEGEQLLAMFENLPRISSRSQGMDLLQLTTEERKLIDAIQLSFKADKDRFSIYTVSRHASAPSLEKGFKTGREMYAVKNGLTQAELDVAAQMEEILGAAFAESGIDMKRMIRGYWPHLRNWVAQGVPLDGKLLPKDVVDWVSLRYRSGALDVYDTNPVSAAYRHVHGLMQKKHFDPIMPDVKKAISGIKHNPSRELMTDYVSEIMGRPHASFDNLQASIQNVLSQWGAEAPPQLAQDIVNGLAALASNAALPFRFAPIVRNFTESALKIPARVGVSYYLKALSYVHSSATRKEAFQMAQKVGAIRPGIQRIRSLHNAEELFGPNAPRALHRFQMVFGKGLEWYQKPDDWGRAIAYHAQRFRFLDKLDDLNKGRISHDQFRIASKLDTFDPLDIQIAERELFINKDPEAAIRHLGITLAEETMTRYGFADHPAGWNSVTGRLLGQFGTWPVQFKDYLIQGVTRGSMKNRLEFAMTHSSVVGGLLVGGQQVGVNLESFTGWPPWAFTGGPFADVTMNVAKALGGSDREKALARYNLYAQIPIFGWMETGNFRSIFLPGSYAIADWAEAAKALERDDIFDAVMSGLSFRTMRPSDKTFLDFLYD